MDPSQVRAASLRSTLTYTGCGDPGFHVRLATQRSGREGPSPPTAAPCPQQQGADQCPSGQGLSTATHRHTCRLPAWRCGHDPTAGLGKTSFPCMNLTF